MLRTPYAGLDAACDRRSVNVVLGPDGANVRVLLVRARRAGRYRLGVRGDPFESGFFGW